MYISELPTHNSVKFGNLFVKPDAAAATACNSVRLLTFEFEGNISFKGSCTLFRNKGFKYVALTRHQLNLPQGAEVTLETLKYVRVSAINDGELANILTDACIFETANSDEDYHDLLFLRVAADSEQTVNESYAFIPCTGPEKFRRLGSFCVGYPSTNNSMDYEEFHLKTAVAYRNCVRDLGYKSNSDYLVRYKCDDAQFDFDGFSGGAVFSLVKSADGYELMLDGIIVRGGNGNVYTVSCDYLKTITSE